ncbi:MAG TPA: universal stress protein [Polyangia bacterium]|nr:universal stress protein [Polyangia bacterium]
MALRKILVAIDFSAESARAIDTALELVRGRGGTLTLLHVVELPAYSTPDLGMYVPSPELTDDLLRQAKRTLEDYRARCAAAGAEVEVACVAAASAVANEIVEFAAAGGFDLIVVGSHGRRGLRRFMLGSVAEKVVRTADRPVLTVHARDGAEAAAPAAS